jgi:hypothetical protein
MNWTIQGVDEITIEASATAIWGLLVNGDRLTEWAPMVQNTSGGPERLGAVRRCDVEFDGRAGKVSERCVEWDSERRIAWVLAEDSFGFGKMFVDFGFSFTLEQLGDRRTRVRNETFYRPRNIVGRALSALVMKRRFRALRVRVLENLKRLVEAGDRVIGDSAAAVPNAAEVTPLPDRDGRPAPSAGACHVRLNL